MALVNHEFSERVQIASYNNADVFIGVKEIVQNSIIPTLEKYDNISYIGKYEENGDVKYVLDVGYDNIALCVYLGDYKNLSFGICEKSRVDDLSYLQCGEIGTGDSYRIQGKYETVSSDTMKSYYVVLNAIVRIIEHNNIAKVIFSIAVETTMPYFKFIFDTDNFGNRYVANTTGYNVTLYLYYDTDDFVRGSVDTTSRQNTLDMKVLIYQPCLIKNDVIAGISTNLFTILNDAILGNGLTLIDVDGVKYRNIYGYRWYKEDA